MRATIFLDGEWTAFVDRGGGSEGFAELVALEASGLPRVQVNVPGTVEGVLQALGEFPQDLYQGAAVLAARRAEGYSYLFARRFEVTYAHVAARSLRLVFDGVDTLATYYVNGSLVPRQATFARFEMARSSSLSA